jgi:hypothetical protein
VTAGGPAHNLLEKEIRRIMNQSQLVESQNSNQTDLRYDVKRGSALGNYTTQINNFNMTFTHSAEKDSPHKHPYIPKTQANRTSVASNPGRQGKSQGKPRVIDLKTKNELQKNTIDLVP